MRRHLERVRARAQSLPQLVTEDGHGLREIHGRELRPRRDRRRALAEHDLASRESALFTAEDDGQAMLLAELFRCQARQILGLERVVHLTSAHGCRGYREMTID